MSSISEPGEDPFAAAFLTALCDGADAPSMALAGDRLRQAVCQRAPALAAQGAVLERDEASRRIIRSASLVAAAFATLREHGLGEDATARLLLDALSRWVIDNREAYSLARLGIRRDLPDQAYAAARANFKRRGEERFGAAFVYEQEVSDDARSFVNIRRCLYNDFLSAIGMPQVTPLFCAMDMIWAEDVTHPRYNLRFERPTTLAAGGDACRFQFFRVDQ